MMHTFRAAHRNREDTKISAVPLASEKSALRNGSFHRLAERLFRVDILKSDRKQYLFGDCHILDSAAGPIVAHHSTLSECCEIVTTSDICRFSGWARGSGCPARRLLLVNIDIFDDLEIAVSFLQGFRMSHPMTSVIIASAGFARDDFDCNRIVITDLSLRAPLSRRSLEAALFQLSRTAETV